MPALPSVNAGLGQHARCGNGICEGPENPQNCPADCAVTTAPPHHNAPLCLTTMTHMEGNWTDDQDQALFLRHVEQLRYGMDLAAEYGAILTVESEKPFARANVRWNVNIM